MMGRIICCGLGPGDPDLMSVRADREVRAATQIAYFRKKGRPGQARTIVEGMLSPGVREYPMEYPVTTELDAGSDAYARLLTAFYDDWAARLAKLSLEADVVVLCEGDPFFYGSYMYLHDRLAPRYDNEVVPGVCSMLGGAAVLGAPLVYRNQSLSVLSGVLPETELKRRLADADAAVIMKLGRNFDKVRRVLGELGLAERALYVERATMGNQRIVPLAEVDPMASPYFSLLVVPGEKWQG
jgi:precorrin-2/cobalt-factor-2 C20-methyltransferase